MRQVTVINCDAHVDTTNHTPRPLPPVTRPVQPTERPAGTQGFERCLRLCPFPSFQRLLGSGSNKRHHRAQSEREARRRKHYTPPGICPVVPVPASAQLPDTITLASRTISPFLADRASFQKYGHAPHTTSFETLVTKKPISTITTYCSCPRTSNEKTPPRKRERLSHQARPFHRFHCPARSPSPSFDPRTFAIWHLPS